MVCCEEKFLYTNIIVLFYSCVFVLVVHTNKLQWVPSLEHDSKGVDDILPIVVHSVIH